MRISPPIVAIYSGCTSERATGVIEKLCLRNCEPAAQLISGIWFQDDRDLLAVRLAFDQGIEFCDDLVLVSPEQKSPIDAFVAEHGFQRRITCDDLLAVRFHDTDDKRAFEEELGIPKRTR